MSNIDQDRPTPTVGAGGRLVILPVAASTRIYAGAMVGQTSHGVAPAGTCRVVGVSVHGVDNSVGVDGEKSVAVETDRAFVFDNATGEDACSDAMIVGHPVFAVDDHTVANSNKASTLYFAGSFMGMEPDGNVRVMVTPGVLAADVGALTDSTGGTANGTLEAVSGTYSQAVVANNFADVAAKINGLRNALVAAGIMG